jgi:AraC-like DNA-binding protein
MLWGSKGANCGTNKPHRHTMHELFISMDANGSQYVENTMCRFMRGRAFFLPEGSIHYIASESGKTAEFAFVCFEAKHFLRIGNVQAQKAVDFLVSNRQYFSGIDPEYLRENIRLIENVIGETETSLPLSSWKTDCLLGELIINYYRSVNMSLVEGDELSGMEAIQHLIRKILLHPETDYPLAVSAKNAGMSISKFCNNFRKFTGTSLTAYANEARLKKAVELIKSGDMQISRISFECGFGNLGYFHKVFKRRYATSPFVLKKIFRDKGEFPKLIREY